MALQIFNRVNSASSAGVLARLSLFERLLSSATEAAVESVPSTERDATQINEVRKPIETIKPFRTQESDPRKHSVHHLARMYTVPPEVRQKLLNRLPKEFERLTHTFTETCIMVRKPFLEITNCIKAVDFSKPAVRFVVYGRDGFGKSLTLAHVLHYGFNSGYLLIHVPWVNTFMRHCRSANPSETKPGMLDIPIDASNWLLQFKSQNQELLEKLNLVTSKSYVWGVKENTPEGSSMSDLIEFGMARSKYACDVVDALLQEIKMYSTQGRFKTMVVIDGFNGLFSPFIIDMRRKKYDSKCTLAQSFLKMASYDWCNSVVILSVDRNAHSDPFNAESHHPLYLLGREGWEYVDPFIPIEVEEYDEAEANTILDYYIDRLWLQHPEARTEAGKAELKALSGRKPIELMKMCAPL